MTPYKSRAGLPESIKEHLPAQAQDIYKLLLTESQELSFSSLSKQAENLKFVLDHNSSLSLYSWPHLRIDNFGFSACEYKEAFNNAWERFVDPKRSILGGDRESASHRVAWAAVKKKYLKNEKGRWIAIK
jgi:cation transport regulator ChaB